MENSTHPFYSPPLLQTTGGEDTETVQRGYTLLREPLLHDRITLPLLVAVPKWPGHFLPKESKRTPDFP